MSTIAAISTAPGNAGIGIVRLSGKDSINIIEKIFKPAKKSKVKGYNIKYGNIIDNKGEVIDEVLVSFFIAPKSYTGENIETFNKSQMVEYITSEKMIPFYGKYALSLFISLSI